MIDYPHEMPTGGTSGVNATVPLRFYNEASTVCERAASYTAREHTMPGLKQSIFAATATAALLCVPITPAVAAAPLLFAPWVLGHIIRAGVSLATLPLAVASAASGQQPPAPGYYGGQSGYYAPPNYYARPTGYYAPPQNYYARPPGYYARPQGYYRAPQAYYRPALAYARPMPQFYAQARGYHARSDGFAYRGR